MSDLRVKQSTTRSAPDLMKVIEAMRQLRCDAKPHEIARYSGLSQARADRAMKDAEDQGLVHVGLWRLTDRGKT